VVVPPGGGVVGGANIACVAEFPSLGRTVTRIDFLVDGQRLTGQAAPVGDQSAQATFVWDATGVEPGEHKLTVRAYAGNQLVASDSVTVQVAAESSVDLLAPQVHVYFPKQNSQVSGQAQIQLQAFDNAGVSMVSLFIDKQLKLLQNVPPFTYLWDTTGYSNGPHLIEAWAFDQAQNRGEARPTRVMVNNPGGFTQMEEGAATTVDSGAAPAPVVAKAVQPKTPSLGAAKPKGAQEVKAPAEPSRTGSVASAVKAQPLFLRIAPKTRSGAPRVRTTKRSVATVAPKPAPVKVAALPVTRAAKSEPRLALPKFPEPRVMLAQAIVPTSPNVDLTGTGFSPVVVDPITPKKGTAKPASLTGAQADAPAPIVKPVVAKPSAAVKPAVHVGPATVRSASRVVPAAAKPAPAAKSVAPVSQPPAAKVLLVAKAPKTTIAHPAHRTMVNPPKPIAPTVKVPLAAKPLHKPVPPPVRHAVVAPKPKPMLKHAVAPAHAAPPAPKAPVPAKAATHAAKRAHALQGKPSAKAIPTPKPSAAVAPRTIVASRAAVAPAPKPAPVAKRVQVAALPKSETGFKGRAHLAEPVMDKPFLFRHSNFQVKMDGKPVDFDVQPMSVKGVPFAPLRQIVEHGGGMVLWLPASRTVQAVTPSGRVQLTIGSRRSFVDGKLVIMDEPAFLEKGRTMVPLRFIQTALNLKALYDPQRGLVQLYQK
jgi:hypothetical protein